MPFDRPFTVSMDNSNWKFLQVSWILQSLSEILYREKGSGPVWHDTHRFGPISQREVVGGMKARTASTKATRALSVRVLKMSILDRTKVQQ
jgi:hypothetical protein